MKEIDANQEVEKIMKLQQVEQHLKLYYSPVMDIGSADVLMTTLEVFFKMQDLFPCPFYTKNDVLNILTKLCFRMFDMGEMQYEWAFCYEDH